MKQGSASAPQPSATSVSPAWSIATARDALALDDAFISSCSFVLPPFQPAAPLTHAVVAERVEQLGGGIQRESRKDAQPVYAPLVGLALMVFFAITCQCMSTFAVVKRGTQGWRWPTFLFVYTGALAWLLSFAVYQGGRALGFG